MPCCLRVATSGAIVMSDVARMGRLLWPTIDAIEIGSLDGEADLHTVLDLVEGRHLDWAMHMPLWRRGPARVPLTPAGPSPEEEHSLRADMILGQRYKAAYALAHAPWLPDHRMSVTRAEALARETVRLLRDLAWKYDLPVVLELKLGLNRDPGILSYLLADPEGFLDLDDVSLCLDTGDWLLACEAEGVDAVKAFEPLAVRTAVVHAHAVERGSDHYLWKPIHPSSPDAAAVRDLCQLALDARSELTLVFEHTPHVDPGPAYDLEGYHWLLSALTCRADPLPRHAEPSSEGNRCST